VSDLDARLSADDIGTYCRAVEDHLTRVNAGHLVRIVGTGFELVRGWAMAGVPLSVVYRGIDMKAERHREGQATRPLRIEFCESDVRAVFDNWRRAIGLAVGIPGSEDPRLQTSDETDGGRGLQTDGARGLQTPGALDPTEAKKPSLTRHLDRAIDRLSRVGGRLDLPVELRDACDRVLQELAEMRASAGKLRGPARDAVVARLAPLDAELAAAVRAFVPDALRQPAAANAVADLAPYRGRLSGEAWQRSVDITTDRLLRDRLGLPLLEL
jgi:hypothetical protein